MKTTRSGIAAICVAIFIAALVITVVFLDQKCVPERPEESKASAQHSTRAANPSEEDSPFVQVVKAIYEGQKAQQKADSGGQKYRSWAKTFFCDIKITDFLIAALTILLVAIGGWQGYEVHRTVKVAQVSADAAALQTRASIASQLPVVGWAGMKLVAYDHNLKPVADPAPHGLPPVIARAVVSVKNGGPTKANVWRWSVKHQIAKKLPEKPVYGTMSLDSIIVEEGQTRHFTAAELITISKEEMEQIEAGELHLWIYSFFTYADFLEEHHEMAFSARWVVYPPMGFVNEGPEAYTYTKHEKTYTRPTT